MQSPVKKLDFESSADKENKPLNENSPSPAPRADPTSKDNAQCVKGVDKDNIAVSPVSKLKDADEPLLQENPQRFVLFPIKYHEARWPILYPR